MILPATDEVDLSVTLPLQSTVAESLKMLSSWHVAVVVLPKVSLPERAVPAALMEPVKSPLGHLMLCPPVLNTELVDAAETTELTGVAVAKAELGATKDAPSRQRLSSRVR
jgi:hypothetical protein